MTDENPEDTTPSPNKQGEETPSDTGASENPDYQAEREKTEKLTKQLGQAEHKILVLTEKLKQKEKPEPEEPEQSVEERAERAAKKVFAGFTKAQAKSYARSITGGEDKDKEVERIMFHYENSIIPTGDMERDIRRAQILANEGRISKDLEQAKRAALAKQLKGKGGGEGGQVPPKEGEGPPPMDEKSKQLLKGFKWDAKRQGYVGPSGRFHPLKEIQASILTK